MKFVVIILFGILNSLVESLKSAVVVGSGPSGLASALVLAKRHGYQVTVLEATEREDILKYDPRKGYPFLISPRGQKFTSLFPEVQTALEENGVGVEGSTPLISIPADPNELVDIKPKTITMFKPIGQRYWIRRHEFSKLLLDYCSQEKNIQLVNGVYCKSVGSTSDSEIKVLVDKASGVKEEYKCSLLIAADGMRSSVRESLSKGPSPLPGWKNNKPSGFKAKKWNSPASGLKFKTLNMNPDATIPIGDGSVYKMPFNTETFHAIRSVNDSPTTAMSLGILPSRESSTRALNVIRIPSHEVWQLRDGKALREWFSKAFPRFDFSSQTPLIEQTEFDRFASEDALTLPPCQYSPQLHTSSPTGDAAVIILGDAAHTFPPDLGEGVNSGLEDVVALDKCLGNSKSLGEMATKYSKERIPETRALVKLARVGAPFQYNQAGGMLTVKKLFWSINFFTRLLLNKITFGITPPGIPLLISERPGLKYTSILKRADFLTASLWAFAVTVAIRTTGLLTKLSALFAPSL